ncbi:MAG: molecular chaperone HtpG [Oscillospiraceae bacterium]|jgi:molecular chaperone HtpG|nr:molecular chaperone HtpG [Oscillospiraceae bacterium]
MPQTHKFKAESRRLLELMIGSIYTHKEIFLRELISNASDALDKLYYKSLTENLGLSKGDLKITLSFNKDARTLTIADNGIGMSKEELENNLGVIAESGSFKFKQEMTDVSDDDTSVIGQFGVGFYSAFMVADNVSVTSKAYGSDQAFLWASAGAEGYTIEESEKDSYGTEIVLHIKEDAEGDEFSDYLTDWKLRSLIKKYSDFIRYPIQLVVSKHTHEEDELGEISHLDINEVETLNTMVPIWKKSKAEVTEEGYNSFYKDKFRDISDPLTRIHSKTEGAATYDALLFIPEHPTYDYYTKDFAKGLELYSHGVMIAEKCADLLPDYFSFVRGLVDSEDLSLNISREMLQHDRQLKTIAKSIERSIKNELKKMQTNERARYEAFWEAFGNQIKFSLYNSFGMLKEKLADLLLFKSYKTEKPITLQEYFDAMKEGQEVIYYASGSEARIRTLPQVDAVADTGVDILLLTANVDEFVLQSLVDFDGKDFRSVQSADLDTATAEEKSDLEKASTGSKRMLTLIKNSLGGKVSEVRLSNKLKNHPVCIAARGNVSVEMEKVLSAMPQADEYSPKAEKVLEVNSKHPVFAKLKALYAADDKETIKTYAEILYAGALLIEGATLDDPSGFVDKVIGNLAAQPVAKKEEAKAPAEEEAKP